MMNALIGSVVGGLAAGVVALVATTNARPTSIATPVAAAGAVSATAPVQASAPATVQCDAHQYAALQRAFIDGREIASLVCVDRHVPTAGQPVAFGANGYATSYAAPAAPSYGERADIVQVEREPVVQRIERPVIRNASAPRAQRVVYQREQAPKRSWKKTALVIGGAAGAGAGIGALTGGKKGALIGAAIGGGSGAVYEVIKRK